MGRTPPPTSRNAISPAVRYRLEGTYKRLRRALLNGPDDGRVDHPLSYWVLPTDRRLPIAFLDQKLRDLLQSPLDELMQTPGVGQKKILGFFDLLRRAIKADSPHQVFGLVTSASAAETPAQHHGAGKAALEVSEAVWNQWCETILRAGFGNHLLGRVAPSLRPLPSVVWNTPLSDYAGLSLAEIRGLKTHGRKRVNAIVDVFGAVHEAVSTAVLAEELQIDVTPRFVPQVTTWIVKNANALDLSREAIRTHVAKPLVAQIQIDLGEEVALLARERLGIEDEALSVKAQAARLKVTRARIYQILEECGRVFAVRWPEGRWLIAPLLASSKSSSSDAQGLLHSVQTLFYPSQNGT